MTAATTHRRLLILLALSAFALVFVAFLLFDNPGLGIGHFYYLPVALIALSTGPRIGALAGCAATALYAAGVLLNPDIPSAELLTVSAGIRLIIFAGSGAILGWFAASNQALVEKLQILAERDHLTGLPNTRAFEAAIARRFESGRPFALLLGDMDGLKEMNDRHGEDSGDDALRRLGGMLANALEPSDELARVGGDEFAVLASLGSTQEAAPPGHAARDGARGNGHQHHVRLGRTPAGRTERALALPRRGRAPLRPEVHPEPPPPPDARSAGERRAHALAARGTLVAWAYPTTSVLCSRRGTSRTSRR
jgi:GGDEF domain-containing protein